MNQPFPEQIRPTAGSKESLKRLSSGTVLLAREALHDPNFEATVVLICVYSLVEGSYGLVLNRVSHMPLSEVFDGITSLNLSREILIGGPVQQNELQILQITDDPVDDSYQISSGIHLGGKWTDLNSMIETDPKNTKLFLGYSGWGPAQLEAEIQLGAWDVYLVDIKQLLQNCHLLAGADTEAIASFLKTIEH